MFHKLSLSMVIALVTLAGTARAQWVDYQSMINQAVARQNQIVDAATGNAQAIVRRNMSDPRIRQMYLAYRNQGGPMSLEQFAYYYAATAGGTNVAGYVASENAIAANEARAHHAYRQHVGRVWADTNAYRSAVNDRIASDRGDLLTGRTNYYNPHTGGNEYLPYTNAAGQGYTDAYGNTRVMNQNGYYTYGTAGGWNYQMTPVWNR